MSNVENLEKVAFAGFPDNVADNFKRINILIVADVIRKNPQISKNHCYKLVKDKIAMDYKLFISILKILNVPFRCLKEHAYVRSGRRIVHLELENTDNLDSYLQYCKSDFPEVLPWLNPEQMALDIA